MLMNPSKFILKITIDTSILKTMNIDIEIINTFEKKNKIYTTQWRKIYKIIEPDFSDKSDIFPDDFIKQCEDNANEYVSITI